VRLSGFFSHLLIQLGLLISLLISSGALWAIDPLPFKDRAEELRFQGLTAELRCLQCQNQNLADSDSALAKDLRQLVFEQMQGGKSDQDIKQYLITRYGHFVIYDPPVNRQTLLLWLLPILAFGVLAGALLWRARLARSRKAAHGAVAPAHHHEEDW
jgi:cytochrome c-type biogenesis protein CcmH